MRAVQPVWQLCGRGTRARSGGERCARWAVLSGHWSWQRPACRWCRRAGGRAGRDEGWDVCLMPSNILQTRHFGAVLYRFVSFRHNACQCSTYTR